MPQSQEVESLSTSLINLQDEKRRWRAEQAKSEEVLRRKRDRYERECHLIARMKNELSKAQEDFDVSKSKAETAVDKMAAAVDAKSGVTREIESAQAEMERREDRRRRSGDEAAREMDSLMEEMMRKRKESRRDDAVRARKAIETRLTENGYVKVVEEAEKFEEAEKGDMEGGDAGGSAALDAVDVLSGGMAVSKKELDLLGVLLAKAAEKISRLRQNEEE